MIHLIDLHFQHEHTIASYLIETSEGPVLVEVGPHSVYHHLEEGLARFGYKPSDIGHVLLTHIHFDHAGAAWALAREGAKVYVHPVGYPHMLSPQRLYDSARRIYGDQMESLWGKMESIPEEQLISVAHGDTLTIGNTEWTAHHTPGHASHHIAWQLGEVIFTGDVAGCRIDRGLVVPPCPPPDINLEQWKDSIALLRSLKPEALYLTHFDRIDDVDLHLSTLEVMLDDWSQWIKVQWEAGRSPEEVTPEFEAYVYDQLAAQGMSKESIDRYESANPAYMSVTGLMRYWKKKI